MARAYTLSNGSLLVGVDRFGHVRDVYFPRVGLENHVSGNTHRVGIWVDGIVKWLNDPSWQVSPSCDDGSMAGHVTAHNEALGVELRFRDVVYNERDIFLREVHIHNLRDDARTIKLFFGHEFRIWESPRGDTGYYDPNHHCLIHYKGRRVFLMNARLQGTPFSEYSMGLFQIEGKAGSYQDAADGTLSMNPIEHGSVDSVLALEAEFKGGEKKTAYYWMTVGRYIEEVQDLNQYVLAKTPAYLMRTASDFWKAWVHKEGFDLRYLSEDVGELFHRSLFVVRAHADRSGAIIASSDSDMLNQGRDTYSYMWPRDGAYAALALANAGDFSSARKFFRFCNEVITKKGYFMHKYLPDGSVGSSWHPWVWKGNPELPIQEDETALVLIALHEYYTLTKDVEFIEEVFNTLVKNGADFIASYLDESTGLPHASYDLWEQSYGTSTYTSALACTALRSAASLSTLLGKMDLASAYVGTAENIRKKILEHCFSEEEGMFRKLLNCDENGGIEYDNTIDMSSVFALYAFGVLEPTDARVEQSVRTIEEKLQLHEGTIGGVPRYVNDGYYRQGANLPPNPWIITTLWLARYYLMCAKNEKDLEPVKEVLEWVVGRATPSGMLPEQVHPISGDPVSATPLVWSHAEFVMVVILYLQKLTEFGVCESCYPIQR